jgi:hypothetical protein
MCGVARDRRYGKSHESKENILARNKTAIRRDWTKEDVRDLKTLAKKKVGVAKIAKQLKRTPGATAAKACTLGVSLSTQ